MKIPKSTLEVIQLGGKHIQYNLEFRVYLAGLSFEERKRIVFEIEYANRTRFIYRRPEFIAVWENS
jgi:hypothetical protein